MYFIIVAFFDMRTIVMFISWAVQMSELIWFGILMPDFRTAS